RPDRPDRGARPLIDRDLLALALTNLGRRKLRTALTTLGIFVGILTIVTMVALATGVQEELTRQISGLGLETIRVTPSTSESSTFVQQVTDVERTRPIRPADVEALQRMNGVASVQPALILPAFINLALRWQGREELVRTQEALSSPFFLVESRMLAGHQV